MSCSDNFQLFSHFYLLVFKYFTKYWTIDKYVSILIEFILNLEVIFKIVIIHTWFNPATSEEDTPILLFKWPSIYLTRESYLWLIYLVYTADVKDFIIYWPNIGMNFRVKQGLLHLFKQKAFTILSGAS